MRATAALLLVFAVTNCRPLQNGGADSSDLDAAPTTEAAGPFGSGNFGQWITDAQGLPAYRFDLSRLPQNSERLKVRHPIGNGIVTAMAHPDGPVELFTNRTFPRFANKVTDDGFGGGFGYLQINNHVYSTYGQDLPNGALQSVVLGMGYLERKIVLEGVQIEQRVFTAPGEEALLDEIRFTNLTGAPKTFSYVSYWDVDWTLVPTGSDPANTRVSVDDAKTLLKVKSLAQPGNLTVASQDKDPAPKAAYLAALTQSFESFEMDQNRFFGIGDRRRPQAVALPLPLSNNIPGPLALPRPSRDKVFASRYALSLPAQANKRLVTAYGIANALDADAAVARLRQSYGGAFDSMIQATKGDLPTVEIPGEAWIGRELAWSANALRTGMVREDYWKAGGLGILNQGSAYLYQAGWNAALRDPLQHVMPLYYVNPASTRDTLLYVLRNVRADGRLPYGTIGYGKETSSLIPRLNFVPSDIALWLLWSASEYVFATRDWAFLDQPLRGYDDASDTTVRQLLKRTYDYQVIKIGYGAHGLVRILNSDWNDVLLLKSLNFDLSKTKGESTLNSALAVYAYDRYARLLEHVDPVLATTVRNERATVLTALKTQWKANLGYNRGYVSVTSPLAMDEVGEEALWLEANAFALLSPDTMSAPQRGALLANIKARVVDPAKKESMTIVADGFDNHFDLISTQSTWYSISSAAIQGLIHQSDAPEALPLAWDEFKLNTLAQHAEAYPDVWYGIWTGPDAFVTKIGDATKAGESWMARTPGYSEFPVANMHAHSQPLLLSLRFAGVEVDEAGYTIAPKLPASVPTFAWKSRVLQIRYEAQGAKGLIKVATVAPFKLTVAVPQAMVGAASAVVVVNGQSQSLAVTQGRVSLQVTPDAQKTVAWEVHP